MHLLTFVRSWSIRDVQDIQRAGHREESVLIGVQIIQGWETSEIYKYRYIPMCLHPDCTGYGLTGDGKGEITKWSIWAQWSAMEEPVGPKDLQTGGKLHSRLLTLKYLSEKLCKSCGNVPVPQQTVLIFPTKTTEPVTAELFSLTQLSPHYTVSCVFCFILL